MHSRVHSRVHSLVRAAAQSLAHNRVQQPNRARQEHWEPEPQQEQRRNQAVRLGQAVPQWMNRASCPQKATALARPQRLPVGELRFGLGLWPGQGLRLGLKLPAARGLLAGLQPEWWHWQPPAGLAELTVLAGRVE